MCGMHVGNATRPLIPTQNRVNTVDYELLNLVALCAVYP